MKKIILLLSLTITACTTLPTASAMQPLATRSAPMDTPTATLDYQATIDAANAGADQAQENSRIAQQDAINARETSQAAQVAIVAFTAQAEQVELEYVRATQQIEAWTATAVLTSMPATMTQQAINNTQIPAQQMIISTAQAMTIAAPTVAAAMLDTQQRAKYGWINYMAAGLMSLTATVLMIWAIIFINHNLRREQEAEQSTDEPFIIPHGEPVQVVVQTTAPNQTGEYLTIPATAEMLTEFADGIINQGKQMALRYWEGGAANLWTRELYYPMRHFMQTHKYVAGAGGKDGRLVLLAEGEAFLRGWLTSQSLPSRHKLDPNTIPPQAKPLSTERLSVESSQWGGA